MHFIAISSHIEKKTVEKKNIFENQEKKSKNRQQGRREKN